MKSENIELYNEELKIRFLQEYDEATASKYRYIFVKAKETEEMLNKDIKDFNATEFDSLLYSMESNSKSSIESNTSILKNYIRFCKKNNLISQGISMIEFDANFAGKGLHKYIKQIAIEKKYPSREEIFEVAESCDNPQDGVILGLIFEGVSTWDNLVEITNLKITDVKENKISITSRENAYNRTFEITDELCNIIEEANSQTLYQFRIKEDSTPRITASELIENEYIIRPIKRKSSASVESPDAQLIRSRVARLKDDFDNQFLTPSNIMYAGILHYARNLRESLGKELEIEDYKKINLRFGIPKIYCYKTRGRIGGYLEK